MAVVQAFNREHTFQAQFDELNIANREQNVYTQKLFSIFFPSIEFLGVLATGAVLYTGNSLLAHHTLTIGTLITALYLLQLVFQPLQELSDVYGQLQSGAAAMVKIATDPRRGAGHPRPARPDRAAADRGRPSDRPRRLRLRRGAGAARRRHPRAGGRLPRPRRRVRRRQVDAGTARRPLLRPRRRARCASTTSICAR